MTIFDVLRYNPSHPPTRAQIDALPQEVYGKWCKAIGFETLIPERAFVIGILRMPNEPGDDIPDNDECYDMLTQILLEHNDDIR